MKDEKRDVKKIVTNIRIVQAICLGVFVMGLSMMVADLAGVMELPISATSITTTLFGAAGSIICEIFARRAEKW